MAAGDLSVLKFASSSNTSDGDWSSPLVAAVAGKKIRIMGLTASILTTAGSLTFKSSTTSTIYQATLAIGTPFCAGYGTIPLCETLAGEAFTPSNGSGVDSLVNVSYYEVSTS